MSTYQPINCEFHDVFESYATTRIPVDIVLREQVGTDRTIKVVIENLYSRSGEEFLLTNYGEEIRLDKVKAVGSFDSKAFA